jgi:hypothetical protein
VICVQASLYSSWPGLTRPPRASRGSAIEKKYHHKATKITKAVSDLRGFVVKLSFRHAAHAPLGGRVKPGHDDPFFGLTRLDALA